MKNKTDYETIGVLAVKYFNIRKEVKELKQERFITIYSCSKKPLDRCFNMFNLPIKIKSNWCDDCKRLYKITSKIKELANEAAGIRRRINYLIKETERE